MESATMSLAQIEQLFRDLHLETEEQRSALRFEPMFIERGNPVQIVTTDSTSCASFVSERDEVA